MFIIFVIVNSFMKSTVLTSSSNFGKYLVNCSVYPDRNQSLEPTSVTSFNLKQNYVHESPFRICKFDIPANRLYLLDDKGVLIHISLTDSSFSTLKNCKVRDFTIEGNNSLGLIYITPNSELFRVSFDNKKPVKITNLNMSRPLAFQRNYLREMLLALDYKLLFLCELTKAGPARIRSLKAGYNETFTNACFASNNRFIVLVVKNVEIRIVEIADLKTIYQIRLPFQLDKIKIEVSYDSKKIAIYGECNIVFFITLKDGSQQFTYELIEVPFEKSIAQLRFTYQNDILFLGSDQILYGVLPEQLDRAIPLFNQEYQMRMMAFDISLNCTKIAIVSNRTVYQLAMKRTLRETLLCQQHYKLLEYRKNGFEPRKSEMRNPGLEEIRQDVAANQMPSNDYQYEDEDYSEQDSSEKQSDQQPLIQFDRSAYFKSVSQPGEAHAPMNPVVSTLQGVGASSKQQINQILHHLLTHYGDACIGQTKNLAQLIAKMLKLMQGNFSDCFRVLDLLFSNISIEMVKFQHECLIFCPELAPAVEIRLPHKFLDLFTATVLNLAMNYFTDVKEWVQLINFAIANIDVPATLPLLIVALFKIIAAQIVEQDDEDMWEIFVDPSLLSRYPSITVKFNRILHLFTKLTQDERSKAVLNKAIKQDIEQLKRQQVIMQSRLRCEQVDGAAVAAHEKQIVSSMRLQSLILKQEQIRKQLSKLRKQRM